ncbi:MAG: DUF11 domain-containing protein [Polyangiaceae bacterium]|nr:DUF11 domain-containing protein [Polyangiaceae bacterium]
MRKRPGLAAIGSLVLLTGLASDAIAAPMLRLQVVQRGDFVLFGNTLGYECAPGGALPIVGTVGTCGTNTTDSAPDIYWRADAPGMGQAQADLSVTRANARSTAMLALPAGATITHAYLYWGAGSLLTGPDTAVTLERNGVFSTNVSAMMMYPGTNQYQSVADVTSILQTHGPGAYRVGGIDGPTLANVNNNVSYAGWWMAVFYENSTERMRSLSLYEGLEDVGVGLPLSALLSGFLVPSAQFDAKLGVIAYEGDAAITGDQFFLNGFAISDAQNPAMNFFNSTRSTLGIATHLAGDLPEMPGTPNSLAGLDLDVVDIAPYLAPGQTSAQAQLVTTGDVIQWGGFVTSVSTLAPDFSTSTKTAVDVNGSVVLPGDTVEYTITVTNMGEDTGTNVMLTDVIPAGLSYVPNSLVITQGANAGLLSDAPFDDQGEYDFMSKTLTVRLGAGATASMGGNMAPSDTTTVVFHVTVDPVALGPIQNQATINAAGQSGFAPMDTLTDGNGPAPGRPPTVITVVECATNAQCTTPAPYCAASNECVECLFNAHCSPLLPTCEPITNTCVCMPSGAETCDGIDNDCNGQLDDGFNVGAACSAGIGACQSSGTIVCTGNDTSACNAVPGTPVTETCDGIDNDCDGTSDEGFGIGAACSAGVGACQASGTIVCDGNGGTACNAVLGTPVAESCDGIDNDCNGQIDNGLNLGAACSAGIGACQASGTIVCDGNGTAVCNAMPGTPVAETCDAIDNDCDGTVDDGLNLGAACSAGVGACQASGTIACDGNGGTACNAVPGTPVAETCDGIDNDCNGQIDNGFSVGTACSAGVGACQASGTIVCDGNGGAACNAVPGTPVAETCDGIDNDCDGTVDDGFSVGTACSAGIGACQATGTIVCDGNGGAACNAVPGTPVAETCDGIDNDCDSTVDNSFSIGAACSTGVGACQASGMIVCDGNGGTACNAVPGTPVAETCDGIDNDCDSTVDNGFDIGTACSAGVGACQANGIIVCDGNGAAACNAVTGMPVAESCDGIDNDCDGTVDNGFDIGTACSAGVGACETNGVVICDGNGGASCNAVPGTPVDEICDGADNDCDGTVDNGFDIGKPCAAGVGTCQASGVMVCSATGGTTCDAVPGMPVDEVCDDGSDNDCDGTVDEGCTTQPPPPDDPATDGGCACTVASANNRFGASMWLFGAAALMSLARRKLRRAVG